MQKRLTCYNCKKVGHWARECTQKCGVAFEASRPAEVDSEYPATHCRCGQGLCQILVSASERNPGRKYYRCPGSGPNNCNFFKFCDELRKDEIRTVPPPQLFPDCGCKAGICTVVTKSDGLSYFVCPIKKGQGACDFSQLKAGQTDNNAKHGPVDAPPELPDELVLAELEGWLGSPIAKHIGNTESPNVWENAQCPDSFAKSGSASDSTPEELPAEVATSTEAVHELSNQKLAPELHLVRFGMQSPGGVSDAVEMENSPGSYPGKRSRSCSISNISSQNKKALVRCLNLEGSPCPEQANTIKSGAVVNAFDQAATHLQKELTDLLCCLSPPDHLTMLKESEYYFSALDRLQFFSIRVKSYIERAAALAEIEKSIDSGTLSSQELVKQYEDGKSHVDEISDLHDKKQQQLQLCGMAEEAAELKSQVLSLSGQLWESKRRLKVVCAELGNALKLAEEKDIELSAAKAAFEKARAQLLF